MEGYTGEGEPPCIVMTLKTDDTSPPDLSLPIILTGVREPNNTLLIKRPAEGNVIYLGGQSPEAYSSRLVFVCVCFHRKLSVACSPRPLKTKH